MHGPKIGLPGPKRPALDSAAKPPPPSKKRLVLDDGEDDDEGSVPVDPTKPIIQRSTFAPKKKKTGEDEIDPSIYDYDAAFDAIHARDAIKKAAEQEDAELRRPKYIHGFLASAQTRKQDQLRAREKMLLKEREAEGGRYAGHEEFVTSAYKKQMEENAKLEEEEADREAKQAERREKLGMKAFHQSVIEMEEKRHREAIEAAAAVASGDHQIAPVLLADANKDQLERAKQLAAAGKNIAFTDDGYVADKRQLLSAGLNVVSGPKPGAISASSSGQKPTARYHPTSHQQHHQQTRPGRQQDGRSRSRQTQAIEDQIEEAKARTAEKDEAERRKLEEAAKSKKTASDISSARERYLERKKAAAAAAGGKP